jgi:uncharacterized protein YggE
MKRAKVLAALMCCIAAIGQAAQAQSFTSNESRGLTSTATESVTIKPAKIRLVMWIKAQGKDAKSALIALNAHKEKVKKELASMKADADSITFSSSRIGSGNEDQQQRMIQMQMRAMRSAGGESSPAPMPKVVTATCALKAEWPLPVQEGDALALLPASLGEQITARDLAGEKNKPELSESEQEQMDEMQKLMEEQYGGYYGSNGEEKGPNIQFVATATEAEVATVTKKAFETAVSRANSAAQATGVKLGKLNTVSVQPSDAVDEMSNYMRYSGMSSVLPPAFQESKTNEVVSTYADELKYSVIVSLAYNLE